MKPVKTELLASLFWVNEYSRKQFFYFSFLLPVLSLSTLKCEYCFLVYGGDKTIFFCTYMSIQMDSLQTHV